VSKDASVNRRTMLTRAALATGGVAGATLAAPLVAEASGSQETIVGVWFVDAVGAPFEPHLFTFHADQTMLSSNPDAGDPQTSDSDGMGPWAASGGNQIIGAFEEINADRDTHEFVSRLRVEYTITLDGSTFTGPASATYFNPDGTLQQGPFPATLNGRRIPLPTRT
jgi:hypothetical protein